MTCACGKDFYDSLYAYGAHGERACFACAKAADDARRAARRAELAALPRCEVPGCKARGTWRVGGNLLLCKRHLTRAQGARARTLAGPCAILGCLTQAGTDRESLLKFAQQK